MHRRYKWDGNVLNYLTDHWSKVRKGARASSMSIAWHCGSNMLCQQHQCSSGHVLLFVHDRTLPAVPQLPPSR